MKIITVKYALAFHDQRYDRRYVSLDDVCDRISAAMIYDLEAEVVSDIEATERVLALPDPNGDLGYDPDPYDGWQQVARTQLEFKLTAEQPHSELITRLKQNARWFATAYGEGSLTAELLREAAAALRGDDK